ncbi:FkbM family methyltransferase [Planktomarina sp.]|nr:FkbM family methyltransferase [Planktomarina sp.]MDA9100781.1 FkbM family methyltransferase [Planktomarina sp.]
MATEKVIRNRLIEQLRKFAWFMGFSMSRNTGYENFQEFIIKLKPTSKDLIRIGAENDGGYLMPNDLKNIEACFSPGVDYNASFEMELAEKYNITSFLADYSVEAAPSDNPNFNFTKKYLGSASNEVFMTLEEWISKTDKKSSRNLLLQMDIEGGEYAVLSHASLEILQQFRVMIVEFHKLDLLFSKDNFRFIESLFDKVLEKFDIVHIHPNNTNRIIKRGKFEIPPVVEITFVRKDLSSSSGEVNDASFPHALDAPNHPQKSAVSVPDSWLKLWSVS